ncbi:hypothetical protein RHSIM_Rhsim07G0047700 [Rhododendron simsii]|uniref:GPI inositol-deacylase n=1 Tax=Rhododendron simsii TaxID=118357 RepID=A0A834GRT8_RHOSS|nr:hypothetical protein RHSIM_Rhsim07G0047700 [Rhododendron simsii]
MALALALPPPLSQPLKPPRKALSCRCSATSQQHQGVIASSSQLTSLNYRPAVILPGLGNNTSDYDKLKLTLNGYGVPTVVAKVSRIDWLRNAAGLVDPNYWRGTLRPRPVLDWYLKRVDEAVNEAKELAAVSSYALLAHKATVTVIAVPLDGGTLSLIGHSAGGWLARVYMEEFGLSNISLLLTLGTPHLPPPKGSPGVIDQTRGLLNYVEKNCSKAVYTPELRYVCIAGRYIQGARFLDDPNVNPSSAAYVDIGEPDSKVAVVNAASLSTPVSPTFRARFVGQGYKQVCGQADVWGDGVVPEVAAHLEGALNLSFDGVYHSPVGSDDESIPWYGSPAIVEQWIHHLLN